VIEGADGEPAEVVVTTSGHLWSFHMEADNTVSPAVDITGTTDNVLLETAELNGDDTVDLVVVEQGGAAVTVLRTNRVPTLTPLDDVEIVQDESVSLSVAAEDPDGDLLTFDVANGPSDSSFDSTTGAFNWTPTDVGMTELMVGASDWFDHSSEAVHINVAAKPHVGTVTFAQWKTHAITKVASLRVQVDGPADRVAFAWSRPDGTTWHGIGEDSDGSDGWATDWNTGGKNGNFRLRARAFFDGEEADDTTSVVVDNRSPKIRMRTAKVFSPNSDGSYDGLRVRARASERSRFSMILRRDGRTLRRWSWQSPRRSIAVKWNGRADGRKLRDAAYRLYVRAEDRVQRVGGAARTARIDTKAPSFRWRNAPHGLVTKTGRLGVRYRASDRSGNVRLRLKLLHAGRVAAGRSSKMNARRGRWSIRPRYRDGSAFVPGPYLLRAKVTDRVGNTRSVRPKQWDYAPPRPARAYMRLENTGRQLALTFDDCNFGSAWQSILNTLRSYKVKATFFCGGAMVRRYPDMARRVVNDGHIAASHGYNHRLMTSLSYGSARSQIAADRKAWMDVTGRAAAPFFRPPYGAYDRGTLSIAGSLGFSRVMIWDVDTQDWKTQSSISTSSHVLSRARSGSVVLMHVLPSTAAALPSILKGLRGRSLKPVTLTGLFRSAGYH
jgi:peptidoglycan/xylan/chitin deacetylase (PgdA/CDA1 family)